MPFSYYDYTEYYEPPRTPLQKVADFLRDGNKALDICYNFTPCHSKKLSSNIRKPSLSVVFWF